MVFLCADGATVNMGQRNGMAAKWKSDINHLIVYSLELGVSKAIKDHSRLKHLNDDGLLIEIFDPCCTPIRLVNGYLIV